MEGLTSIPDNFNPTVGGYLYLANDLKKNVKIKKLDINFKFNLELNLTWKKGKYRVFDGIFCEVIKELKNITKVKIKGEKAYIVRDNKNYSHGFTIKEARDSLVYKLTNKNIKQYKNMNINTILSFKDCIQMYRSITGACEFGTKNFVLSLKIKKKKYSIKEVIEITKGQYGNDIVKQFFMKKKAKAI